MVSESESYGLPDLFLIIEFVNAVLTDNVMQTIFLLIIARYGRHVSPMCLGMSGPDRSLQKGSTKAVVPDHEEQGDPKV